MWVLQQTYKKVWNPRNNANRVYQLMEYLNNPNLKRANVQIPFTKEQVSEYKKCAKDPIYFLRNYYWIMTVGGQEIQFKPRRYQKKMLQAMIDNRFVISKWPRQSGKSTVVIAFFLWTVMFHKNRETLMLSKDEEAAKDMLHRFKFAYEKVPMWMQSGVTKWDVKSIRLENNSSIRVGATTTKAGRSGSFNIVFLDEFAFVDGNKADDFYKSVYPTISAPPTPGDEPTKLIIVSTPKGMNLFYDLWVAALEPASDFVTIEVNWDDVPGRDQKWWDKQVAMMGGEEAVLQEFGGEFIGAENTLIRGSVLDRIKKTTIFPPLAEDDGMMIFKGPVMGHKYCIAIDTSEGIGQDHSAFQVIDVTEKPYEQVASFYNNRTDINAYPGIIYQIARKYNESMLFIELNNGLGDQVASHLYYDIEYENVVMTTRGQPGRPQKLTFGGYKQGTQLGIKTTNPVKNKGAANLKEMIENDILVIHDKHTHREFTNFTKQGPSFKAEPGAFDDLVMSLVLFGWLVKDPIFEEMIGGGLAHDKDEYHDRMEIPILVRTANDPNVEVDDEGNVWHQAKDRQFWF